MIRKALVVLSLSILSAGGFSAECTLSVNDTLPDDHLMFVLDVLDDRLEGASEYLEGFTLTMQVPKEFPERGFDYDELLTLIRNQPVCGTLIYPNGKTSEIRYEVVDHRGMDEIYMKTTLGYFLWECADVQDDRVLFVIDWWYCPPTREVDLRIIEMAKQLLADSTHWHKADDRRCEDDVESDRWSLFCALKHSSVKLAGEYNHHNTAMQTVRFVIDDIKLDHGYAHTLMDYNNDSLTTFNDILQVLDLAGARLEEELTEKNR